MTRILAIGEILVEIMADTVGEGFREPLALTGPFPSGAPAIFASQAARMGAETAILSAVGDDDFGRVNLDRLSGNGVDVGPVLAVSDRPTGTAFVRYRPDGARDFVFNIGHSACAAIPGHPGLDEAVDAARHLHVVGTSLFSREMQATVLRAAERMRARGGSVSLDPNLRKEVMGAPGLADTILRLRDLATLFLPSGEEIALGCETDDPAAAAADHLARGAEAVVHKRGADGATLYLPGATHEQAPFPAEEIDPTGAGDCFCGAFVASWLAGEGPETALRLACAAGAHAVTRRGPMEGAAPRAALERMAGEGGGGAVPGR